MYQPNIFDSHHHHLLDITHNKTSENEMDLIRDDEYESKSGTDIMEAPSGDDQDPNQRPKKKRYHRHTQNQIQEMESFFNECPHPDDKQRKELGRRLGLEPLQVKFWFQNKRTQMKAQHERHENTQLRNENEKLRAENIRYKEALSNATCPNCGGPAAIGEMSFDEQHLRIENARLREEMSGEFQVPSPLVPTRENYFVRYCKHHSDGTWAVVDVSLDNLRPTSIARCRRRPSGCLIQELPNGYSKVTWVEHVEIDDRAVHTIYKALVNSGLAFGARRWVATLDRQCERLASLMANNIAAGDIGVISSPEGRKSMLKLAERMVMSFCTGVGASTAHTWTTLSGSGADDVRVMTRKSMDDPGRPPGIVLSAATSFWLPVPPKRVFDFLRDENSRSEWDILSNGGLVQEMAHIANGRDPGNSVSLLRVNSQNSSQSNMLILQESSTDSTGSYVIYAPVDIVAMNVVLSGGDPDYVALLPSGFAILPDGPNSPTGPNPEVGSGGSLLTVAFQILVDSVPTAKLSLGSVATVNSLIKCTVERIKGAVLCDGS
ncbi:homeobox-leucine zipper protein ROC1 [Striga asiatica]|uniref:Homeobox-leucine zipper protein ROC1 n=1 Tax=Striga asiatica TaxID=4170 RepID=A0A5A7QHU2_STRAF|nr:homeobox-leucine zipper protein ROC1 [Striga asiatica]